MNTLYCSYRVFTSYWFKHWFSPRTYWYWAKYKIQRANRGWADCDTWSLDDYLAEWLPDALRYLKKHTHGYPCDLTEKKWDEMLEKMSVGFEAHYRICGLDYSEGIDISAEMKKDEEIFKEGAALFIENFGSLWD